MRDHLLRRLRERLHTRGFERRRDGVIDATMGPAMRRIARQFEPRTIIDVGVAWGTPGLLTAFPKAHFLLVEPLAEFEAALQRITRRYHAEYVLAAAGARRGRTVVHVRRDLSSSGERLGTGEAPREEREVPVVTLDSLCAERGLSGPFLIKVDVQGAELDVLDGAMDALRDTELVVLEVSLFELFDAAPSFSKVVARMADHGFVPYEVFGGDRRPLDGALAQIDVAFAAEHGVLRQDNRYSRIEPSG